jgi:hypothetical protein
LIIDKNVEHLTRVCDRHHIIACGRTVWRGTSEQPLAEPDVQHRYLGIDGERPEIGRLSVHRLPIDGIRGSDKIASRLEAEGYQGFECAGFGKLSSKVRGWR